MSTNATIERRREVRLASDDVIRWKHPGKFEDFKGWTIDRSPSGYGFMAKAEQAPKIGERINIRRLERDRWDILGESFRVTRAEIVTDELTLVGCVEDDAVGENNEPKIEYPW